MSTGVGGVGWRSDRQNAQGHRMFHWVIPVLVFSRMSWSLACDDSLICLTLMSSQKKHHRGTEGTEASNLEDPGLMRRMAAWSPRHAVFSRCSLCLCG